jgi:hypothetical protein
MPAADVVLTAIAARTERNRLGSAAAADTSMADVRPVLTTLSGASAIPVLSALREIHRGYVEADRLAGSLCITGSVQLHV